MFQRTLNSHIACVVSVLLTYILANFRSVDTFNVVSFNIEINLPIAYLLLNLKVRILFNMFLLILSF